MSEGPTPDHLSSTGRSRIGADRPRRGRSRRRPAPAWVLAALLGLTACGSASAPALTASPGRDAGHAAASPAAVPLATAIPSRPLIVRGATWLLRASLDSGQATTTFTFGPADAFPVAGDWNADGVPTAGSVLGNTWRLRNSNSTGEADVTFRYGVAGDLPIVGDWNGDGTDTPGVVRGNTWYLRNSNSTGEADVTFRYGVAGDLPIVGDWDGNGTTTPGVIRGNVWYLSNDTGSTADITLTYGSGCDVALSSTAALARSPGGGGVPARFAGQDITVVPTSRKVVALTFDAGADAAAVPSIIRTLGSTCTPATFFLTGSWVREFPAQARRLSLRYPVGNHTNTHPDLTKLTDAQIRSQVTTAAAAVKAATAYDTHPLFRFPFGARDARTIRVVNGLGYLGVRWTVDTLGWKGTSGGQSVATVVSRVLAGARNGEIVLMHVGANPDDGSTLDADALPTVIRELTARGYGFATLPELL